jgi:hypothetical protein
MRQIFKYKLLSVEEKLPDKKKALTRMLLRYQVEIPYFLSCLSRTPWFIPEFKNSMEKWNNMKSSLPKELKRTGISSAFKEGKRSNIRNVTSSSFYKTGQWTKSKNSVKLRIYNHFHISCNVVHVIGD